MDPRNRLEYDDYMMKSLMEMTKNQTSKMTKNESIAYNTKMLINATFRYIKLHRSLFGKYKGELMRRPSAKVLKRVSGTFQEFLEREKLQFLIPLFTVTHTGQGYGYLDEIGALYGLMWNTPEFVASIIFRGLGSGPPAVYIFKYGFEHVWNTIAKIEKFDIRFNVTITSIDRLGSFGVMIHYKNNSSKNEVKTCDFLIWTPPMPDLLKQLTNARIEEKELFTNLTPHYFGSSLMRARGTIRNRPVAYYRTNLLKNTNLAVSADMDMEAAFNYDDSNMTIYNGMSNMSRITTVLQLSNQHSTNVKFNTAARMFYEKNFNSTDIELFKTIIWPYMYKWNRDDVANGNHWKVFDIQGKNRTWYAGASVCFESVKSVMEYNNLLLRQLDTINNH